MTNVTKSTRRTFKWYITGIICIICHTFGCRWTRFSTWTWTHSASSNWRSCGDPPFYKTTRSGTTRRWACWISVVSFTVYWAWYRRWTAFSFSRGWARRTRSNLLFGCNPVLSHSTCGCTTCRWTSWISVVSFTIYWAWYDSSTIPSLGLAI